MKKDYKHVKNKYYDGWCKTREVELTAGDRDTILTWIYNTHVVEWYTTYIMEKPIDDMDVQDYIGEIYLMLAEIPQSKWDDLYQQGKYAISGYVTGVIKFQIASTHSKIYFKYVKRTEKELRFIEGLEENFNVENYEQ